MPEEGIIEEILLKEGGSVLFNGQPVGVILAETFDLANYAVNKVLISYVNDDSGKAIIPTISRARQQSSEDRFGPIDSSKMEATKYGRWSTLCIY